MSNKPLISVLITTFNAESTIQKTLDSIKNQSFQDFEIVLIDDGSNDQTISITKNWKKINNISCDFHYKSKIGRANALNFGLQNSSGKFISICDGDDLWHRDKLKIQCDQLKQGIDFIFSSYSDFTNLKPMEEINDDINFFQIDESYFLKNLNKFCHSSLLIKKKYIKYKIIKSQLDIELYIRLFQQNLKGIFIENTLVYKRIHKDQKFESKSNFKYRLNGINIIKSSLIKNRLIHILLIEYLKLIISLLPLNLRIFIKKIKKTNV